jgi:hypothetical protein
VPDGDGFKIAAGYVEIHLKDSTEADFDAIRQRVEDAAAINLRTTLSDPDTAGIDAVRARLADEPPIELATLLEAPDTAQVDEVRARLADEPPVDLHTAIANPDLAGLERIRSEIEHEPPIPLPTTLAAPEGSTLGAADTSAVEIPTALEPPSREDMRHVQDVVSDADPIQVPTALGAPSQSSLQQARVEIAAQPPVTVGTSLQTPSDAPVVKARALLEDAAPADVPTELGEPGEGKIDAARLRIAIGAPIVIPTSLGTPSQDRLAAAAADIERRFTAIDVPTQATDPITEAWRAKVKSEVKQISGLAVNLPVNAEMAEYREQVLIAIGEIESAVHQEIPVQVAAADRFKAEVLALASQVKNEVQAQIPVEPTLDTSKAQEAGGKMSLLMASAVTGGLVAAGPAIGAALIGGTTIGMAALGAYLQKDNPAITQGWHQVATDFRSGATVASEGIVPPIAAALAQLDSLVLAEEPAFRRMFTAAAADTPILANGLADLARNALPGLDAAMQHSIPIATGLGNVERDLGTVIGNLGNTTSANSAAIGSDLTSLGSTVRILGNVLGDVEGIASNLGTGALPVLNGALTVAEGGVHAVETAAAPLVSTLGGVGTTALVAWAGFKGVSAVASGVKNVATWVGTAGTKLSDFAAKVETSSPRLSAFASSASSLVAKLGPAGLAGIGGIAVVAVSALTSAESAAAQRTAQHADAVSALTTALAANNGQVDTNVSTTLEQQLQSTQITTSFLNQQHTVMSLADAFSKLGINQGTVTSAIENGGGAYQNLITQLQGIGKGANGASGDQFALAQMILKTLPQVTGAYGDAKTAAQQQADAVGNLGKSTADAMATVGDATPVVGTMTGDITLLADKTQDANTQIAALQDEMSQLAEHGAQKANDAIEGAWKQVDQLKGSLAGTTGPLLTANGDLDLTSTKGQAARDAIKSITDQMGTYAQNLRDQHTPAQQMFKDLQTQEDQLAGPMAKQLGLTTQQVEGLFAKEGLIPANITTSLETPGLTNGISDFGTLFTKVAALPPGKTITTNVTDYDSLQALQDLGYKIVHLPNGQVAITARDNATGTVNQIIKSINGRTAWIDIKGNYQVAGVNKMSAHGNLFTPAGRIARFAEGGMAATLTPMSGSLATVVPPNTWRVVGDNMTEPEAFIPLDPSSRRSQDILSETNRAMGRQASPSQTSVTNNYYITQQPQEDGRVLAARVAAQNQWALMTTVGG